MNKFHKNSSLLYKYNEASKNCDFHLALIILKKIETEYKDLHSFRIFVKKEYKKLKKYFNKDSSEITTSLTFNNYFKKLNITQNPTKGILKERQDDQNDWYFNEDLENLLSSLWSNKSYKPLPKSFRRILVIATDLEHSTGLLRSLSNYLNFLYHYGGYSIKVVELDKKIDSQTIFFLIESSDIVIINGLPQVLEVESLPKVISKTSKFKPIYHYIHATKWHYERLNEDQIKKLKLVIPNIFLLAVSEKQVLDIKKIATPKSYEVMYELPLKNKEFENNNSDNAERIPASLIMTGTIQKRKGFDFFCKCAAELKEQNFSFKWAGIHHDSTLKISDAIEYLGRLTTEKIFQELKQTEIFFLSSYDDPFPHSAIEAYMCGCKLLLPRATGLVEIFEGLKGVLIYEEHDIKKVTYLINKLKNYEAPDKESILYLENKLNINEFSKKLNNFIEKTSTKIYQENLNFLYKNKKTNVAIILHLFYLDLACEFRRQLQSLQDHNCDIYISIPNEKFNKEIKEKIQNYFTGICKSIHIIGIENSGMDILPFFKIIKFINEHNFTYDYIIKVHSKKSILMSGKEEGEKWRVEMLNSLLGNRENTKEIFRIFETNKDISIIAPKNYLIEKSSFDHNDNPNQIEIENLKSILNLDDANCKFFVRGTMFWVRSNNFLKFFKDKQDLFPLDFPKEYIKDGSLAHAYERILTYIGKTCGEILRYQLEENERSTSLSQFHGLHKDEDIYVIASGPSTELINKDFFNNKITIGCGQVYKLMKLNYTVNKEYVGVINETKMLKKCDKVFNALYKGGNKKRGFIMSNKKSFRSNEIIYFDHYENELNKFTLNPLRENSEKLFVSWSTITSAIHLAFLMGAKNIILVGHDCGTINNSTNISPYKTDTAIDAWGDNQKEYIDWLPKIESQTIVVRNFLRDEKNVNIVSLNPFINLSLEGNIYSKGN